MLNPDDRKALEDLLHTLNELAAASADLQRACNEWLDTNSRLNEVLFGAVQHPRPLTHKRPTVGKRVPEFLTKNYRAVAIPNEHDDNPDVN